MFPFVIKVPHMKSYVASPLLLREELLVISMENYLSESAMLNLSMNSWICTILWIQWATKNILNRLAISQLEYSELASRWNHRFAINLSNHGRDLLLYLQDLDYLGKFVSISRGIETGSNVDFISNTPKSQGDWIAFVDDDDTWDSTKLERQMSFSDRYDFICCDAIIDGVSYTKEMYKSFWFNSNPTNTDELNINILSRHNVIINSSVLVKKSLLESVGYVNEQYRMGEDHVTWVKILSTGVVCKYLDESLVYYNSNSQKHYNDNFS